MPILSTQQLNCTMHHPLVWNASRHWKFDLIVANTSPDRIHFEGVRFSTSKEPDALKGVYLLRDHVTLLQDLIADWGSGPPVPLEKHIPIQYSLKIVFSDFRISLCVNPLNVINQPNDLEDNGEISIALS